MYTKVYAMEITECIKCEHLIFNGEEVTETSDGLLCSVCTEEQELAIAS